MIQIKCWTWSLGCQTSFLRGTGQEQNGAGDVASSWTTQVCNEKQRGGGGGAGGVCKLGLKSGSEQLAHLSAGVQRVMLLILSHVHQHPLGRHSQSMRVDVCCAKRAHPHRRCKMLHLHLCGLHTHVAVNSCPVETSLCKEETEFQNGSSSFLLFSVPTAARRRARAHKHTRYISVRKLFSQWN